MSLFSIITWICAILALIGVILNIKKNYMCFYLWTATNAAWAIIDFQKEIYAQAMLFVIYTGLALWGIYEWQFKGKDR